MPLIALLLVTWSIVGGARVLGDMITDAIVANRASKAGQWDVIDRQAERREARRAARRQAWTAAWSARRRARHERAGGDGEFQPGFGAYWDDLMAGFWARRIEVRRAKRAARGPYVHDPSRPSFAERVDAAILAKLGRVRDAIKGDPVQPAAPLEPLGTAGGPAEPIRCAHGRNTDDWCEKLTAPGSWLCRWHAVPATDLPPGTWTVGPDGEQVPLAPADDGDLTQQCERVSCTAHTLPGHPFCPDHEPAEDTDQRRVDTSEQKAESEVTDQEEPDRCQWYSRAYHREQCTDRREGNGRYCRYHAWLSTNEQPDQNNTEPHQEEPMAAPAPANVNEVNTNEDLRQNFRTIASAAARAQDALAALEQAKADIDAAAKASVDGVDGKKFDADATATTHAVNEAADAATLSHLAEAFEAAREFATTGLAGLDAKWADTEAQVASEGIDPTVLASNAA